MVEWQQNVYICLVGWWIQLIDEIHNHKQTQTIQIDTQPE